MRRKSLWILIAAIFLSILGHLILFFGIPFISFGSAPPIAEDLIIKTELRVEPPKKIQLTSAPKKDLSLKPLIPFPLIRYQIQMVMGWGSRVP